MARQYIVNSWVGASEYSGEQVGDRRKQSVVIPESAVADGHFTSSGGANIQAYSDCFSSKIKVDTVWDDLCLLDREYEQLSGISEILDSKYEGKRISLKKYKEKREALDISLDEVWGRICKARSWDSQDTIQIKTKYFPDGTQRDYACLPENSVFHGLSEHNILKKTYLTCLILSRKTYNILSTVKTVTHHIFTEGLI